MAYQGQVREDAIVVAIDFGTTYSGYAFHLYEKHNKETTKIDSPRLWKSGRSGLISLKTPTSLFLDKGIEPDVCLFGFEAEKKYKELCIDEKNDLYYFFRKFKMQLQDEQGITKSLFIEDETGKVMLALDIFALSIKCMKDHLMKLLENRGIVVEEEKIFWVLTVPAIWKDAAKQFMRESAIRAGIQSEKLEIALELEAASFYCQYVPLGPYEGRHDLIHFALAPAGTRYMVVDLGGGTADMTVHEKLDNGRVKELSKPSGGPWGGTMVDSAFMNLLISIVGRHVMNKFMKNCRHHYLNLCDDFEAKKRTFNQGKDIFIKLPSKLNTTCKEELKYDFKKCLEESAHINEINMYEDNMIIKSTLVEKLFRQATDKIIDHIKSKLEEGSVKYISQILLVGGFSESPFVQKVIREAFDGKNGIQIFIPWDASITIAKGAVLFGRLPQIIKARVLRFTYGLRLSPIFIEGTHPEEKKYRSDTGLRCNDVFDIILPADSEVENKLSVTRTYVSVQYFQKQMQLDVYYTKEKNPRFTTDPGCKLLGRLKVEIPNPSKDQHEVDIIFEFEKNELKLSAQEKSSDNPIPISLNMIEEQNQRSLIEDISN